MSPEEIFSLIAPDGVVSHLVTTAAGTVLVDPAISVTPSLLPRQPAAILLTHVSAENADGCANFPRVPVWVPEGDAYLCHGPERYRTYLRPWSPPWDWESRGCYQGHMAGARNERPPQHPLLLQGLLRADDVCHGLRIVATPGHGKHAVTLMTPDGAALCGDLIYGEGQLWNWFDSDWDYGLQTGQRALLESARRLRSLEPRSLHPTHGPAVSQPAEALTKLIQRLEAVLPGDPGSTAPQPGTDLGSSDPLLDHADQFQAGAWRSRGHGLYQWPGGNCWVLISRSGAGLMVDPCLCHWVLPPARRTYFRAMVQLLKKVAGLRGIELVYPTHYHGDHVEHIPQVVAEEGARVIALDQVAEVLEYPERFNLVSQLWWNDFGFDRFEVHQRLASGARLQWHEFTLEVFHLGGQTRYHSGLQVEVEGQRVIFTGDSVWPDTTCQPVLTYNDDNPETGGWAYAVDRLQERKPDVLAGSHDIFIRHPAPLLHQLQRNWAVRLQQFRDLSARPDLELFFNPYG